MIKTAVKLNGSIDKKLRLNSTDEEFFENHVVHTDNDMYTYEALLETAAYLKERVKLKPLVGIICGSGMGSLADTLTDKAEFPYESIPHFPKSTVKGHVGKLVFGHLCNVPVVCMKGRFHYYEGYPLWKCAMPVRVMKLLGATHLIATNAAGGINPKFNVGDIMLLNDHINLMGFAGNNPLQGPNEDRFGPRFPPMNYAYDAELIAEAKKVAKDLCLDNILHEGVYTCLGGPTYETVAELRMLKMLGADSVGMSTVHEVITARHCDLTVFAFSLITNKGILDYDTDAKPAHEEVIDVGKKMEGPLQTFVERIVHVIANKNKCGNKC